VHRKTLFWKKKSKSLKKKIISSRAKLAAGALPQNAFSALSEDDPEDDLKEVVAGLCVCCLVILWTG